MCAQVFMESGGFQPLQRGGCPDLGTDHLPLPSQAIMGCGHAHEGVQACWHEHTTVVPLTTYRSLPLLFVPIRSGHTSE